MTTFTGPDGTRLAHRTIGDGEPLLVIAGGAMRDSAYLGDLGGLSAHRALHVLDLRGTGRSERPADPATYRVDRQVADVEAFRAHLGLERVDVLGHSAGCSLATLYALRHPDRTGRLALITPSLRIFGSTATEEHYRAAVAARGGTGEAWHPAALAAVRTAFAGGAADPDDLAPLFHGDWNATARAHEATRADQSHPEAAAAYHGGGYDPASVRAAVAELPASVLLLAGEYDPDPCPASARAAADLFRRARTAVQPAAGHYPWLDDPAAFTRTVADFLAS
ncbi:alpha/beta fold hydrolase [Streptomyces sp. FH025]|uniref:alpha/beta fold hydrolase n=1 Tax=Streptomyces sp. FH025 TaxID=2815937 RepID=UPI001A9D982C|nr:alpha/beta hydrolase [Streptomyces sp. FH025]MBO1413916.1 alpha/beta hydrolase [Streptomyces sp. FH025]